MNIYAYTLPNDATKTGLIKVGHAGDSDKRIKEQIGATRQHYEKVFDQSALAGKRNVTDHEIHRLLVERGFERVEGEWFRCTSNDVRDALDFLKQKYINDDKRNDLSEKFYEELRNWYFWATEELYQGMFKREHDPDHALRIIVRLLLIFFLKEKGLVPMELFDEHWINENLEENEHGYYDAVLKNLFFYSLNTPQNKRGELENKKLIKHYNKVKEQLHKKIPFLNGGLFNEHHGDDFALSNKYFFGGIETVTIKALDGRFGVKGLVATLKDYKYTLDETDNTEYIDPEFIGKIFESLLACIEADSKESRRKVTGSYYTPREIVDYMVNEALDAYLINKGINPLAKNVENLLLRCTILDPACGSGAFPCGVMNAIMKRIDPNKTLTQSECYTKKLEILRNVIYGVDIQPMAVQIAIFRLFLSMIQEIKPTNNPKENFGIEPLPNLDYKFCCANALIGVDGNSTFFQEHLGDFNQIQVLKSDYFNENNTTARERLKHRIENIEQEIAAQFQNDVIKFQAQVDDLENIIAKTTIEAERDGLEKRLVKIKERLQKMISAEAVAALCEWNHSDTTPSPYFDSRWMFGIEKFDIVIGNPPYGAKYPEEHKKYFREHYKSAKTITGKQKGSLDTFSLFIELGFNIIKKDGFLMFIVPLSIISSDSMTALHKLLFENCNTIKVSSYSDRPKQIFGSSRRPISIISFSKTMSACESISTTKLYRLFSDLSLQDLINGIVFAESQKHYKPGCFARISETIESSILEKVYSKSHTPLRKLVKSKTSGSPLYYRQADGGYYSLVLNHTTSSKYESAIFFDKRYANVIGAILSSNLFFWHQKVYSDNYHLKQNDIKTFPIPLHALTDNAIKKIEKLYVFYERDVERNAIIRETNAYTETKIIKEYKLMNARDYAHQIDDIICPLYGLTSEEREFIKNYELQFRIDENK